MDCLTHQKRQLICFLIKFLENRLTTHVIHRALFRSDLFGKKIQVNTRKKKEWIGIVRHIGPVEASSLNYVKPEHNPRDEEAHHQCYA